MGEPSQQRSSEVKRFSRAFVLEDLDARIAHLEHDYGFKPGWGWARVEGKETPEIVAFGRYQALLDVREEFEE